MVISLSATTPHHEVPKFDESAQDAVMDALIEGIVVMNESGEIERFNEAAVKMFGYTTSEAIGQPISILMPEGETGNHFRYVNRYLRTREPHIIGTGRELLARRKDGSTFPIHLAIGEVGFRGRIHFIGMMRDLTDDKNAEERRLRQHTDMIAASRLATMGEMAAAMAHEINQPLAAIANYASAAERMLGSQSTDNDDIRSTLQKIKAQSHRAGEIIRKLRVFVKPESTSFEPTDVRTIIDGIRSLAELDARANNVDFTIDIAVDMPQVLADELQLQQVILNMIRNGIDAMLDCEPVNRQLELHGYMSGPEEIRVDVLDRGPGVADGVGENIFNPFFSTKSGGMGMGLAISQTIVKSHGGRLGFENNADGGATFFLVLPTQVA